MVFFNTKLHVCAVEVSALHQHVFMFHGQYNGIHGWESTQTCVGKHTLVAANPRLFFCIQEFMLTLFACLSEGLLCENNSHSDDKETAKTPLSSRKTKQCDKTAACYLFLFSLLPEHRPAVVAAGLKYSFPFACSESVSLVLNVFWFFLTTFLVFGGCCISVITSLL